MIADFIMVFAAMTLLDFLWGHYTAHVASGKAIPAALFASGIIVATGFVTAAYISNNAMIVPAALGAFFGTWFSVKCQR